MPLMGMAMMGLTLGQGLMGGFGASSQAKAQAMQARMQAENANFQRQWQIDASNRNITKANLSKALQNQQLERLGLSEKAIQEVYQKFGFDNSKSQYSKQTNQVNSALLSSVVGRNISASSGTARALLRQNMINASANMANLRITDMNKRRDIETTYQNRLNQRDFNYQELQGFMPGDTSMVSANNTGQIIASSALGAMSAGLNTSLQYGKK